MQNKKYNGKEWIEMHGLNEYDYGARGMFPAIGRFTTVDPLCEKHYSVSPYAYCLNNPVKFIDPDGKEKLQAINPNNEVNKVLIAAANNFDDDKKVINIWAHGNEEGLAIYHSTSHKSEDITNSKDFIKLLDANSEVWKSRKDGEKVTIVLHSCNTGSENEEGKSSFARKLSEDMKDVKIIAPNSPVYAPNGKEKGPYEVKTEGKQTYAEKGRWIQFEKGKVTNSYNSDSQPGSKKFSNFWNRIINLFK